MPSTTKEKPAGLAKGKLKQRLIAYMEASFRRHMPELQKSTTDFEINELVDSFRTIKEIAAFNQYNQLNKSLITLHTYIRELAAIYVMCMRAINGYMLLWDAEQKEQALLNLILEEIKATGEGDLLKKVTSLILDSPRTMSTTKIKDDGSVFIDAGYYKMAEGSYRPNPALLTFVRDWAQHAAFVMSRAKATISAIKVFLKDSGIVLKDVNEYIKLHEERLSDDWTILPKYRDFTMADLGYQDGGEGAVKMSHICIYPHYERMQPDASEYEQTIKDLKSSFDVE